MGTLLGETLKQALHEKLDYSKFIWKNEKKKQGKKLVQDTEKMIDMSPERLKECWKHCQIMLNNKDPKNLGRYNVLEEINSQIHNCNIELLLRYFENSYITTNRSITKRSTLILDLKKFMYNNSNYTDNWNTVPISEITNDLPSEFKDITISDIIDGCLDELKAFNKQRLTLTFLTKMGLWFTKAEEFELKGKSKAERIQITRERLKLPQDINLRYSEKGLSYHEMRAMLVLPIKQKYSDMTTEQLITLRNKVLLRLSKQVEIHIFNWIRIQKQIEFVARMKNINLND